MTKASTPKVVTKKHQARLERERTQNRNITITAIVVLVLVFGVLGFGFLNENVLKYNRPVARVGNETITTRQFQKQVRYSRYQLIQRYTNVVQLLQFFGNDPSVQQQLTAVQSQLADPISLGDNVLNQMIEDILVRQEAARRGITVSKEEVDKAFQEAFGFFPEGTPTPSVTPTIVNTPTLGPTQLALITLTPTPTAGPSPTPTATMTPSVSPTPTLEPTATQAATATPEGPTATATIEMTATPEPTATPYTQEGYQKTIQDYLKVVEVTGYTEQDLRALVEIQVYRQKVQDAVLAEQGVKAEAEQVWARHILVADEATANDIYQRLQNGEDFATLAAEFSTDTTNNQNGGDLGYFGRGQMDTAFETAAFDAKIGEITKPVKSSFGWHIIQVIDHAVRPLSATEYENLRYTQFTTWLDKLRADSKDVTKYDNVWQSNVPTDPTLDPALIPQQQQ